jgi:6,7-dimethyl-8-ribityllumazine synthase
MATHLKSLSDFSHTSIPNGDNFKIGIVTAQWNAEITGALYNGAVLLLEKQGVKAEHIVEITVPGSFELTSGADLLLANKDVDAVICLGCVIQGETPHFDFICDAVANGITQVSIKYNKPVIFGVLTTNTLEQAQERAGGKHGNKGEEAAATALLMANLQNDLKL